MNLLLTLWINSWWFSPSWVGVAGQSHLLKAGVDFASISQWLGHASLNTTMVYARADLVLKRQAPLQVFPDALASPKAGNLALDVVNLVDWLRRL